MTKEVSVIIPVYNVSSYLEECLESVCRQTLKNIEIICIDDGSTDSSLEIIKNYAVIDSRIRFVTRENRGYGYTVNEGIKIADGMYVSIVEPDDYIEPHMLNTLYKKATEYNLDFIKGDYSFFKGNKKSRVFERIMISPKLKWYNRILCPEKMPELLDVDMMNVTGIYKREFLLKNNIKLRETPGASFQDTGLWFQAFFLAKKAMFIPKKVYNIRRDNPNSSVFKAEKLDAVCSEYDAIEILLKNNKAKYEEFKPYIFKRKLYAYLFVCENSSLEVQKKVMNKMKKDIEMQINDNNLDKALYQPEMLKYIQSVYKWDEKSALPTYKTNSNYFKRIYECIKEHGFYYTLHHLFMKIGFSKIVI